MIVLGIVGSRYFDDYDEFKKILTQWIKDNGTIDEIVSGGANGVDSMAKKYANENKIKFTVYEADWNTYGDKAGPMRNTKIVEKANCLLALPGPESTGTWDTVIKAQKKKIKITNIGVNK
jgi:hypothetical protein